MTSQIKSRCRSSYLAIFLLVTSTIVAGQTTEPKPTGSISGHVTVDGKPAGGIPVAAVAGQTINVPFAPFRSVTDLEGNYRITGLKAGEYQVWTMTPGMITDFAPNPNYYNYSGAIKSILLGANEEVGNVDLKLIHGAVITGRVTVADSKPAVEERVSLELLDANGNPRFGALGSPYDNLYQTDDRGIYRIFGLPPGRYRVNVGYDPLRDGMFRGRARYNKAYYLDPADQSKPAVIELSEGGEAKGIDIKLEPGPSVYSVSGRVIDKDTGVPIAKAGVRFGSVPKDKEPAAPGLIIRSDESGEFSWGGLAPGHYVVVASSESYGGNYYGDPLNFEVVDKDVTGLELKTTPGLSLSGSVSATSLSTPEFLKRVPGLIVAAASTGNDLTRAGGRAVVAPDGTFQIDGLRPGPIGLYLTTQRPGITRIMIGMVEHDGIPMTDKFDLPQSMSGLHIVIDYGTGTIRGNVKLDNGTPITEGVMFVRWKHEGARDGNVVQVDSRGQFVIRNLASGPFELILQINSMNPPPARGIPPPRQTVAVTDGTDTEVTFIVPTANPGGP
ncbi:MAG TPA: carboxypeptidase-like regulatory domain-containing protein [Pyrinomonadaceae bacterium]|nr:carboxypeptidase-like regulatory domain-containing protein [Pyrinomonadaceae bacterium]